MTRFGGNQRAAIVLVLGYALSAINSFKETVNLAQALDANRWRYSGRHWRGGKYHCRTVGAFGKSRAERGKLPVGVHPRNR